MSKNRYATNKDKNEKKIVETLRSIGVSVEQNHDDLLCGFQGLTFWIELKSEKAVKADGTINENAIKKSQKKIRDTWKGHYIIASNIEQIIDDMNESFVRYGLRTVRII